MKRLSRKELTEKVDVLEQKVKSLQEYIYKDKYLNKYFCRTIYHDYTSSVCFVKVKKITGDILICDIIAFNKEYYHHPFGKNTDERTLTNGRLIENHEYSVYELDNYEKIEKQEFDDKIKLMTEQKFNVSF